MPVKLLCLALITTLGAFGQIAAVWADVLQDIVSSTLEQKILPDENLDNNAESIVEDIGQVTSVSQLSDAQPTDWAFQALQTLVERYGCIVGYPDRIYRGNRALSRYEFAAGLNACLSRINELVAAGTTDLATSQDVVTLQRLQEVFAAELATLRGRVDRLEAYSATLEANQFSTTTKLNGEVIFAANAGGFSGDRIVDANGVELANEDPNPTILYRAALILNTSFSGTDNLRMIIDTGSDAGTDNATGVLEPIFGSVLDFSVKPPIDSFGISRLVYTFKPFKDVSVSLGPNIRTIDYVDRNSYANLSNRDFSTLAFVNNYILFPVFGPSAGAEVEWQPLKGTFTIRALYAASNAENPGQEGPNTGVSLFINTLYPSPPGASPVSPGTPPPSPRSDRGLFGDTYQGLVELEYAPSPSFVLRLQYGGGEIFSNRFDAFGANIELALSPSFALFGRYGYGSYNDTAFGNIYPNYWMAGIAFRDLLKRGALAGFAAGQPFIESDVGNATQTNYEAFYKFPISDNINITPLIQVVTNPANQDANGTIVTGTLRTILSF